MKKQNAKIDQIMKKAIKHMVDGQIYEWPPQCSAFLYQPIRPKKLDKDKPHIETEMQK